MIVLFAIIGVLYSFAIVGLLVGFTKLPLFSSETTTTQTRFTVVIPFRNEEKNLANLIASLLKMDYPASHFEVLFVNDASEDASVAFIKNSLQEANASFANASFSFKIIDNKRFSESPKKDAITTAISEAKHPWIITTDADCTLPKTWLATYDAYIQKNDTVCIAGPVFYSADTTLVQQFQQFDGLSLQLVTMAGFGWKHPLLCNGANLAYTKTAFLAVNGFTDNNHIASGDDIFMLEKLKKQFPKQVQYLKSEAAIVTTQPQPTWNSVVTQRIRWASKTSKQNNNASKVLGMIVFATNLCVLIGLTYGILQEEFWPIFGLFFVVKLFLDYLTIRLSAGFFRSKTNPFQYVKSTLLYPIITVLVVVKSLSGSYEWKGRKFEKHA